MKACVAIIVAVVVVGIVAVVEAKTLWHQLDESYGFDQYVLEFNKVYSSKQEYMSRKSIFQKNLAKILLHNADNTKTWKEGVNHLSDLTQDEFKLLLGYKKSYGFARFNKTVNLHELEKDALKDLPARVDWREQHVVTSVKDQGQCGSCWTFASASTLESQYAMKTGILPVASEQNILDCVPNPDQCGGTGGCGGGTAELAYSTLAGKGIASEWTYPYISYQGQNFQCRFNNTPRGTPPVMNITGYVKLTSNQYQPLMTAVASKGPIAITVEAIRWQFYESGVFDGCNQANPDLDHNVQLVGYGTEGNVDYWLVRNSWSPAWGEKGYIRLVRTKSEETRCGVDTQPGDGSGCKGGPATVQVCGTCGILYDTCYPLVDRI